MSDITTFAPGDRVVADFRLPAAIQPWIHDVHVGTFEGPHPDWNGRSIVAYDFGISHEPTSALMSLNEARSRFAARLKEVYEDGHLSEREYDRALARLSRAT